MIVYRTDDPAADFLRLDREQQEWADSLPHCAHCGEPMDDYVFDLGSGEVLCMDCVVAKYRRNVEDYLR